jgi:hypothetical protein
MWVRTRLTNSNGQSDWSVSEEFRDYESNESIGETPTIECDNEGNEYGNDEGMSLPFILLIWSYRLVTSTFVRI